MFSPWWQTCTHIQLKDKDAYISLSHGGSRHRTIYPDLIIFANITPPQTLMGIFRTLILSFWVNFRRIKRQDEGLLRKRLVCKTERMMPWGKWGKSQSLSLMPVKSTHDYRLTEKSRIINRNWIGERGRKWCVERGNPCLSDSHRPFRTDQWNKLIEQYNGNVMRLANGMAK